MNWALKKNKALLHIAVDRELKEKLEAFAKESRTSLNHLIAEEILPYAIAIVRKRRTFVREAMDKALGEVE